MADFDDDIDFQKLAKDVSTALAKDEKYQRENDAKFRAIHQKVKSYDEFRDIVEASHLRPLDKDDKIGGVSYQKWNHLADKKATVNNTEVNDSISTPLQFNQPSNSFEFTRTWKRNCSSPKDKCDYLLSIKPEILKKCLDADCMLGDIVIALDSNFKEYSNQIPELFTIFQTVSTTSRFSLSLDFLSKDEALKLKNIFFAFKTFYSDNNSEFEQLCKLYKIQF